MQTKLVDFAVYLRSEASEEERILQVIAKFPSDAQSINQTQYAPLRQRPIAISIETKPPFTGGETADVQLSIWAGAGLMKLTQLLELQGKDSEIPALPVLTFHGHDLYLSVIKGEGRNNVCPSYYASVDEATDALP